MNRFRALKSMMRSTMVLFFGEFVLSRLFGLLGRNQTDRID
jgi:hypothetical protein